MSKSIILKRACGDTNEIELTLYEDGDISLSRDHAEHFIYLYKDQLKKMLKILKREAKPT